MTLTLTLKAIKQGTFLEDGKEFIAASMTAARVAGSSYADVSRGHLPSEAKTVLLQEMMANQDRYFYIVFSYLTPIAWRMGTHPWRIPPHRYSVTTTKHQDIVLEASREGGVAEWTKLIE